MARKSIFILAILLLVSLIVAGVSAAQDQPEVVEEPGYIVCDWGFIVVSKALRPPQNPAAATPEVTQAATEDLADHAVTITDPKPNAGVAVSSFTVSGTGKGLFENNVVVEVLDAEGVQVFQQPITMQTEEVGGAGEWTLDVVIPGGKSELIYAGQPITIHAYSTSAADGSIIAEDSVPAVLSPQSAEQNLVFFLADNDTLLQNPDTTDLCANAAKQMEYPANVNVDLISATGIATASLPPQVNVTATASLPQDCPFPLRALKTQDGPAITIEVFFFFPSDMTCEGEKVETDVPLPMGTISEEDYTITVNDVPVQ
jgi:hypothetical protein